MNAIRARLAAILASYLAAVLAARGISLLPLGGVVALEGWIDHTFEFLLLFGYALLHPRLQKTEAPLKAGLEDAP